MAHSFMNEIALSISGAGDILLIGPGSAKAEFLTYIDKYSRKLRAKIFGMDTVDHPSDIEVVAYAREFFKPVDAMRPR